MLRQEGSDSEFLQKNKEFDERDKVGRLEMPSEGKDGKDKNTAARGKESGSVQRGESRKENEMHLGKVKTKKPNL